jgi:hypothetical protein
LALLVVRDWFGRPLWDIAGPIFLVVDGAGYHRSAATKKFVESTNG